MAQTGVRSSTTTSRSRLGSRNGGPISQSRSGERLHQNQSSTENHSSYVQHNVDSSNMLRNKVSKTHMMSNASTSASNKASEGKVGLAERRRPALGDKTNTVHNVQRHQSDFDAGKNADHTLKHKTSTAGSVVNAIGARRESRPQSASIAVNVHAGEVAASSSSSSSYAGGRHLRGVSSSSGLSLSRQNSGLGLNVENASRSGSSLASAHSSQATVIGSSRRASSVRQVSQQLRTADAETERHPIVRPEAQYGESIHLHVRDKSPETSADEDMSEAESDWQSSSNDGRVSSKTETEDEAITYKGAASPLASSDEDLIDEDEDDEDDEDVSDSDSLLLNSLDPDCLVSLPAEIDELAREKMMQIAAMYAETVVRPAMLRQTAERQEAVARGEIPADVAAHDDELALMGLDPDEVRDTSMVAEYSVEIFEYMSRCECRTMANPNYMDFQGEIRWHMRATLVDWLMQVHMRYHMLPETLWIAINIVDRFLSARVVSLAKLQLVGVTAMFIAAKYEEILAPSVDEFVFMTESGYTREEILKGERIILSTLDFNISGYCTPYSWVRKISKADDYDIQTRTLAKFLMELTLFDHRFLRAKPSLIAAVAMYLSKKMLGGTWNEAFVYYSRLVEEQLAPGANLLLERLVDDSFLDCFVCKKYGNRRFLKASHFAREWAFRNQEQMLVASASASSNISAMANGMSNVAFNEAAAGLHNGILSQSGAPAPAAVY